MPEGHDTAATTAGTPEKTSETVSQFVARVLQQLALSAWLPAGALIGLLALVARLGNVLDSTHPAGGPAAALTTAVSSLARTSVGGALLIGGGVVVLTVVTQAFSFEAIRALEGYWGTSWLVEQIAYRCCQHQRHSRQKIEDRLDRLVADSWTAAASAIEQEQRVLQSQGQPVTLTPNVISALGAEVLQQVPLVALTDAEEALVSQTDWEMYAPPDLLRRRINLQRRRDEFPDAARVQPTRLGNVLRRFEDKTGVRPVESRVTDNIDLLPAQLRATHDEQRTRLDLYGSLVFVILTATIAAVLRLSVHHWTYAVGAIVVGLVGAWSMYRAAVASARAYGPLLVTIANYVRDHHVVTT